MGDVEDIDKLFFEFASESRLSILHMLLKEDLKMPEVANRLKLTGTEAFRQLQRLSKASLLQRQPDGTYTTTQYGRLMLQLFPSIELVHKHKGYFLTHDLSQLPNQFIERIGELSQAELITDTMESMNRIEQMVNGAEQYLWAVGTEQPLMSVGKTIAEHAFKGVKFKFIFPDRSFLADAFPPESMRNIELRGFSNAPATFILTEKEAGIGFRMIGGKVDYAGFIGKDPVFRELVKDLFDHYWDMARKA